MKYETKRPLRKLKPRINPVQSFWKQAGIYVFIFIGTSKNKIITLRFGKQTEFPAL
ncbi:hypothetical protein LSS_01877 [Leptospira santarosai serovar Shermani str. LT 821]|uniref:Uncharacterized protein n=1 Tax=Leptospira santarosai serovar Shermani str. LT 821 TaxID=758847 RepID=K8Y6H5_9LEPT|nr:hypothetical protein LSS_01877 [Leptospira santarosai serovar Shermani str. LT 821]